MNSASRISIALAFTVAGGLAAGAQQPPQQAPAQKEQAKASSAPKVAPLKPAPAKPVVWTDDNIGGVRTSSDNYMIDQQRAQEAAKAAAQQKAATDAKSAQDQSGTFPVAQVKTAQEADAAIAKKQTDLANEQDYIKHVQIELSQNPTGVEKQRLEWRLKSRSMTVQTLQSQIKELQDEKGALAKKPAPSASTSSSSSSQPQSQ